MIDRPGLHVEGKDDLHSIAHLMRAYGVDYDPRPWPPEYPELKEIGSIDSLRDGMETAIAAASANIVGFVLDADTPLVDRWRAVRDRLARVDVSAPEQPPAEGFVGQSNRYKSRVGVWLMPDNEHDGILEHFLRDLIAESDLLIDHAQRSTDEALRLGARFSSVEHVKAVIRAWLAWQEDPGLPFGTAIRARFFRADRPAGQRFAAWFKTLYQIS